MSNGKDSWGRYDRRGREEIFKEITPEPGNAKKEHHVVMIGSKAAR